MFVVSDIGCKWEITTITTTSDLWSSCWSTSRYPRHPRQTMTESDVSRSDSQIRTKSTIWNKRNCLSLKCCSFLADSTSKNEETALMWSRNQTVFGPSMLRCREKDLHDSAHSWSKSLQRFACRTSCESCWWYLLCDFVSSCLLVGSGSGLCSGRPDVLLWKKFLGFCTSR